MPRILRLPALAFADLAHFGLELVMRCIELGLELGRVSARVALEHFSVVRHDLVAVFLDVTDRDFDLPRAEAKRDCDKRSLRGAKGDTGLGDLSLAGTGLRRLGRDPSPGLRATSPTPSPGLRPTSPSPSPGLRPTSPTPSPGLRPTSPRGRGGEVGNTAGAGKRRRRRDGVERLAAHPGGAPGPTFVRYLPRFCHCDRADRRTGCDRKNFLDFLTDGMPIFRKLGPYY